MGLNGKGRFVLSATFAWFLTDLGAIAAKCGEGLEALLLVLIYQFGR